MWWLMAMGCSGGASDPGRHVHESVNAEHAYIAEVWADNWFSMSIGDRLVVEDSVPITTERSFNAERFSFDAASGSVLSFVLKDFKETDSGLEYIGSSRQQMGDGGFIAQIRRQSDQQLVLVSNASWKCLTVHEAPLNKECESSSDPNRACRFEQTVPPANWTAPDFDDRSWPAAVVHSKAAVDPKHGYDAISWTSTAALIWGEDLETANTLLCRVRLP